MQTQSEAEELKAPGELLEQVSIHRLRNLDLMPMGDCSGKVHPLKKGPAGSSHLLPSSTFSFPPGLQPVR
jgi:hypothetical protein